MSSRLRTVADRARWAAFPLGLFLATHTAIIGLAAAGTLVGASLAGGRQPLDPRFVRAYPTWAALADPDLAVVARLGHGAKAAARPFPLLPALGQAVAVLGLSVEASLVVLAQLACLGLFLVFYRLVRDLTDDDTARRSLGLLAAFPFAFHLGDGGPLTWVALLTAATALLARQDRLGLAAGAGALAALAHPAGIAAAPLLLVGQGRRAVLAALAPMLAFAGAVVFVSPPGALALLRSPLAATAPVLTAGLPFAAVVALGAVLLFTWPPPLRLPRALAIAGAVAFLILVATGGAPPGRSLAACWPAFLPLARPKIATTPALIVGALFQGLLLYLFTHRFGAS